MMIMVMAKMSFSMILLILMHIAGCFSLKYYLPVNMLCWDDWCLSMLDKIISDGEGGVMMNEGFRL